MDWINIAIGVGLGTFVVSAVVFVRKLEAEREARRTRARLFRLVGM